MKVSVFENYKSIYNPPYKVNIETVLDRTKEGHHKKLIEQIRSEEDKSKRSELKKDLPCVVFSGYCGNGVQKDKYVSYREDDSLTEHSGLAVFDLDDVTDYTTIEKAKHTLSQLPYVYSAFVSPSGKGLKVLVRIPAFIDKHRGHYKAAVLDLQEVGFEVDTTSINESRISFESYDPDIYINYNAKQFTKFVEDEVEDEPISNFDTEATVTDYDKLNIASKMIANAPDGFKHNVLIKASYLMGGYITSGKVKEDDALKMLRDAISSRDVNDLRLAFKTIDDGLREGKKKPIYQIEEIENEFKTHISKKEFADEVRKYSFLVNKEELDKQLYNYIEHGEEEGKPTGYDELDNHFRFKEHNFNVMLGHDNVGKSTLVWFLAVVASCLHGWKWIIYSPENKTYRIKKQLLDFVLGEKLTKDTPESRLKMAKSFVDEHFIFIRKDKEFSAFDLLQYAAILCEEDSSIKGFMIDPYNSLSLDYKNKGAGLSAYEYHLKVATNMRIFSEKYCSVFLNAHSVTGARRNMNDAEGNLKRPQKGDIEQGGLWANRCDDFMVIHRKVKSSDEWMYTEIHVDKVKDVETGGSVTYEEPVKLRLNFYSDFVDLSNVSSLKKWREEFFRGKQESLPLIEPTEAF